MPDAPDRPPAPAPDPLLSWFAAPGSPAKLRAHYHPAAGRFSHAALQIVPWFDVLLLLVAFALFHRATALVPAEPLSLPAAPFGAGARSSLALVVRAVPARDGAAAPADAGGAPIFAEAFFADEAFDLTSPARAEALRAALAAEAAAAAETGVLVYMEEGVSHGDALRLASLLRAAGLSAAHFVLRPSAP